MKIEGALGFTRGALRVFPGGNQVDGLPPEPSLEFQSMSLKSNTAADTSLGAPAEKNG